MRHLVHLSSVLEQFQGHQSLPAHTHTSSTLLAHKYKSAVGHDSLSKTLAGWLAGSLSFLAFWACAGSCVNMRAILSVGRCAARLSIPLAPDFHPPFSTYGTPWQAASCCSCNLHVFPAAFGQLCASIPHAKFLSISPKNSLRAELTLHKLAGAKLILFSVSE